MLTTDTPIFYEENKGLRYYESIEMNVSKEGNYDFVVQSTIMVYIYLYENYFDLKNTTINLLLNVAVRCTNLQLKFTINLRQNKKYHLLIMKSDRNLTCSFSVTSIGPSRIHFNQTCEYDSSLCI